MWSRAGVLVLGACGVFVACDEDNNYIPFGHAAGEAGEAPHSSGGSRAGANSRGGESGDGGLGAGLTTGGGSDGLGGAAELGGAAGVGAEGGAGGAAAGEGGGPGAAQGGGPGAAGEGGGPGAAGESPLGGQAGEATGGESGAFEGGVCDVGGDVVVPTVVPSCEPAPNESDACRECLQEQCCDEWQACYGSTPRTACGFGPEDGQLGQMDCMLACFAERSPGALDADEVLLDCAEDCENDCEEITTATNDLIICARDYPSTTCGSVCFPFE